MSRKNETITAGLVVGGAVAVRVEMLSGGYVREVDEPQSRRGAVVLGPEVGESGRRLDHMSD